MRFSFSSLFNTPFCFCSFAAPVLFFFSSFSVFHVFSFFLIFSFPCRCPLGMQAAVVRTMFYDKFAVWFHKCFILIHGRFLFFSCLASIQSHSNHSFWFPTPSSILILGFFLFYLLLLSFVLPLVFRTGSFIFTERRRIKMRRCLG